MALPMSGDISHSALLSKMRALLPIDHQVCLFLRYAFLRQLPADVRSHLVHLDVKKNLFLSFNDCLYLIIVLRSGLRKVAEVGLVALVICCTSSHIGELVQILGYLKRIRRFKFY